MIELITVIGVLAIMATIAVTALEPLEQFKKAQDSKRKSDLSQIQKALEGYYQDSNRYPYTFESKISTDGFQSGVIDWGSKWQPYIDVLPVDPVQPRRYVYWSDSTGQSYFLYASLERGKKDPQACNGDAACANAAANGLQCNSGGSDAAIVCNYGVSSPNVSP